MSSFTIRYRRFKPTYMPSQNTKTSAQKKDGLRVLGVDPGYERLGVAIVEKNAQGKEMLLYSDCIRTDKKLPHSERLGIIAKELEHIISEFKPDLLAVETLFFENNQKSVMYVAEARGVIIVSGASRGIPVIEYSPLQVKVATTGDGRADKKQIIRMIPLLIKLTEAKMLDDEYDAIAIALTCLASHRKS